VHGKLVSIAFLLGLDSSHKVLLQHLRHGWGTPSCQQCSLLSAMHSAASNAHCCQQYTQQSATHPAVSNAPCCLQCNPLPAMHPAVSNASMWTASN